MASIFRRTVNGKRIYYIKLKVDGKWKPKSLRTTDRRVAERRAKLLTQRHDADVRGKKPPRGTWESAWWCYENWAAHHLRDRTISGYKCQWYQFFERMGLKHTNDATRKEVEKYQRWLLEQGKSPTTANTALRNCATIWQRLVKLELLSEPNPFAAAAVDRVPERKKRPKFLTKEQAKRLLDVAEGHGRDIHLIVAIGLYSGLRKGEILSLTWGSIDWDKESTEGTALGCLEVEDGAGFEAKTEQSRRIVPLHPELRSILLKHKNAIDTIDSYIVAPRVQHGKSLYRYEFTKTWKAVVKAAGVEWFTPHNMRDTFASWLAQSGVDLYRIAKLLGHTDIQTTQRYAHLLPMDHAITRL